VDPRTSLDDVGKREFLNLSGLKFEPSVVQLLASRYTDYAIPSPGNFIFITLESSLYVSWTACYFSFKMKITRDAYFFEPYLKYLRNPFILIVSTYIPVLCAASKLRVENITNREKIQPYPCDINININ
jgi:hypothetical protein